MRTFLPLFLAAFMVLSFSLTAQVGHWKLDNNFTDSSPNNISGTLIGTPTFSTDSKEGSHSVVMVSAQAIDLGTPAAFPTGTAPRTIAAWAKTSTLSGSHMIASFGTPSTGQAMFIGQDGTTLIGGGWGSSYNMASAGFWTTDTWHHICMTYDGSTARLYADGILIGSIARTYNLVLSGAFIGKHVSSSGWWNGLIDDVRVYDRALTDGEVAELASGIPVPAMPSNVSASAAGSSSINLTWSDNASNETGFEIERSEAENTGFAPIHTTAANATSFSDTGLAANTTYFYRIRAVGAGGNSAYTDPVNATTASGQSSTEPVGKWSLNGNADDSSGNGRNGTLVNGPVYSTESKEGSHSLSLNGSSQYVNLGNGAGLPSGLSPRTMSAWALTNSTAPGYRWIAAYGNNSNGQAMFIGQNGTNLQAGGYGTSYDITVPNFWTTGVWRHICLTYDGSVGRLYADGVELASGSKVWNLILESCYLGRQVNSASEYWNGLIDDVRIYDRALTSAEVQELANLAPPAAPANLAANATSHSQVDLSWSDNSSNETGFEIERTTTSGGNYTSIHSTSPGATAYSDTDVNPNTTYFYRIRAIGGNANSVWTPEVNVSTPAPPVAGPVAHWLLNNNADDASGNARNGTLVNGPVYSTTRKEGSHSLALNGSSQYVNLGNGAGLPTGLSPRTMSAWAMTNSTASGYRWIAAYGNNSNGQAMFIGQNGASLHAGGYGSSYDVSIPDFWTTGVWRHICLTYDGSMARLYADGIEVASGSRVWNLVLESCYLGRQVNSASEYWNGLIDDVRIYDRALTATEVATLANTSPVLTAPSNLTANASGSSQINLAWSDNSSNETGFQIERAPSSGGPYAFLHTTGANVTTYAHTGLTAGSTHHYRVRAINSDGASDYSLPANATTLAIPATPTGLTATTTSTNAISLTWQHNPANTTGFRILRSGNATTGFTQIADIGASPTSYNDNTGLTANTTYYYRVFALNGSVESAGYASASATTLASITLAPPGCVQVKVLSSTAIQITWSDTNTNEDGYQIQFSKNGGSFTNLVTTTASATAYTDQVEAQASYSYRIRAVKSGTNSSYVTGNGVTTGTAAQDIVDQYTFQYKYDGRKRMVAKKVPGADWVYMVYDSRDRLVLTQDGNQRAKRGSNCENQSEWTFTKYDALNRPVLTGTFVSSKDRDGLQSDVDGFYALDPVGNPLHPMFEVRGSAVHGYTNQSFPNVTNSDAYYTATYYDDDTYKTLLPGATNFAYSACEIPDAEAPEDYKQYFYSGTTCGTRNSFPRLKGMVTATKTRVLGEPSAQWLWSVNHYDDKGRIVQNVSTNAWYQLDRVTTIYDFVGKVLHTKTVHNVGQANAQVISRRFDYDHAGRLMETWHRIGASGDFKLLAANEYNEIGQLVTKKLHSEDGGTTFEQEVDHRYNIRGWLTKVNDPTNIGSDLFGMELKYNDPTLPNIEKQFNGNISQIDWKSTDGEGQQYGYSYDPMNRLLEAKYFNQTDPINKNNRFNEKIWNNDKGAAYDLNGNILGIERQGKISEGDAPAAYNLMDNLRYTYMGNQLLKVDDATGVGNGFKNGANTDNDYIYDPNGNMTVDKNKDIDATSSGTGNSVITYNYLNLPEIVRKKTGEYIKYIYDATGRKLRQEVYNANNQLIKKSVYAGEFFYEGENAAGNATATLKFVNTEEGRVVMTGSAPEYQYHLKDHLGNVRVTFTTVEDVQTSMATLEATESDTEQGEFLRYDESVKVTAKLFDHTHRDKTKVTKAKGKPVAEAQVSTRLSGIGEERYGLAKSIRVMPGDKIRMEVFAKYVDPDKSNWQPTFSDALSAMTEAGPAPALDGALQRAAGASSIPLTALLTKTPGGKAPKAFLNYVMYDNDFNPIMDPAQTNFVQVTEASKESGRNGSHERLYAEVEAKQAGYMYIYLSNDNYELQGEQVDVFFDDFQIQQVHSKVVQSDDYYPFGLTFNSYQRENSIENRYLYNQGIGEKTFNTERVFDLGLNLDLTKFRVYDPAIARWWQVDPLADEANFTSLTPYNYSFNDPVRFNDPYGDCPKCKQIFNSFTRAVARTVTRTAAKIVSNIFSMAKKEVNKYSASVDVDIHAGVGLGGAMGGNAKAFPVGGVVNGGTLKVVEVGLKPTLSSNPSQNKLGLTGDYLLKNKEVTLTQGYDANLGASVSHENTKQIDVTNNSVVSEKSESKVGLSIFHASSSTLSANGKVTQSKGFGMGQSFKAARGFSFELNYSFTFNINKTTSDDD